MHQQTNFLFIIFLIKTVLFLFVFIFCLISGMLDTHKKKCILWYEYICIVSFWFNVDLCLLCSWHCIDLIWTVVFSMQNYYGVYGGQQFSPYYSANGISGPAGMFQNLYPYYGQSSQGYGYGIQYPQLMQYPYLPHQHSSSGILSLPVSTATETTNAGNKWNRNACNLIHYYVNDVGNCCPKNVHLFGACWFWRFMCKM